MGHYSSKWTFRYNLQCSCNLGIEHTSHYLLHCHYFYHQQIDLMSSLKTICDNSKSMSDNNKQETLRVVTIVMMYFTILHFENFNNSEGLYITQLNIYDGAFIAKIVSRLVRDLRSETKGSRFKPGCYLCAEVSPLK